MSEHEAWWAELDERQRQEVRMALEYERRFNHGTDGHNRLLLIAKLTQLLDKVSRENIDAPTE